MLHTIEKCIEHYFLFCGVVYSDGHADDLNRSPTCLHNEQSADLIEEF
jgi:hypothetical protein